MSPIDDRQRRSLPESGFGLLGKELFAARPIEALLAARSSKRFFEVSPYALSLHRPSKLQVRRAFVRAVTFRSGIVLADKMRVTLKRQLAFCQTEARLSFSGDPDLFQASVEGQSYRILTGTNDDDELLIVVRSAECDLPIVPYAITSEIVAIRQMLADQAAAIDRHNQAQAEFMRQFVEEKWDAIRQMRPYARRFAAEQTEEARKEIEWVRGVFEKL